MSVGQSILTVKGISALADATSNGKLVKPKYFKVSNHDIALDPTINDLPGVWKESIINGYARIDDNTLEFILEISDEEASDYGRTFGIYLEDGTLFMIAKPPYPFPPALKQTLRVTLAYSNSSNALSLEYIPTNEYNLKLIDYTQFMNTTEYVRQILSTGIVSTGYGNEDPTKDIVGESTMSNAVFSPLSIHNHANYKQMPGMGWWAANVNGFLFRTRHNDYRLFMKDDNGDLIPNDPPNAPNIDINSMKSLFNRYVNKQLSSNEKKYFRWDLSYAEVFIYEIESLYELISDQFKSFRHQFGLSSPIDLYNKEIESIVKGEKPRFENIPYFPIFQLENGNYGVLLYRILSEPLPQYNGYTWDQLLDENDLYTLEKLPITNVKKRFSIKNESILNEIVSSIPGLDGRSAVIDTLPTTDGFEIVGKNYAYYQRMYKLADDDAVNLREYTYGWNDRTLFVAHSENKKVWKGISYMIPLELILRTPLETWNPLNISNKNTVSGQGTSENPYDGWNENGKYFLTPGSLFENINPSSTVADTTKKAYVKDSNGTTHLCVASGIWISLPKIENVGELRIRYPIYYDAIEEGLIGYFNQLTKRQIDLSLLNTSSNLGNRIQVIRQEIELLKLARERLFANDREFRSRIEKLEADVYILQKNQIALATSFYNLAAIVQKNTDEIQKIITGLKI